MLPFQNPNPKDMCSAKVHIVIIEMYVEIG